MTWRVKGAVIALLIMLVIFVPACSPKPKEQCVVVYTSVDQIYAEPILNEFQNRTGIKVLPVFDVEASKTTGLANRLVAEKSRPQADVFWNNEFAQTLLLKERGVLAPYRSPAAADIPPPYTDPEGYWAGLGGRARVILVNTELVPPDNYPRSIFDLLNPAWPGKQVGMAYPLFGTTATQAAALYAALGPEQGRAFYQKLRDRGIRVVDGNSVVRDLVAAGQLSLGLTDTDDAYGAVKKGDPVKIIYPDQEDLGTLVIPGTVALVAGAPHPGEAKALIDYLLSREVEQALVTCGFSQIPLRPLEVEPGLQVPAGVKGMPVSFSEIMRQMPRVQAELSEIFGR